MRVIAGTARSMPLKAPAGMDTRPTTDRIKETLFNILQADVPGSVFIDLFSGSGAIGIEALSRGAKKAYFIENAKAAIACIDDNLKFTKFTEQATVLKHDVLADLYNIHEKHADIIFMDPPYEQGLEERVLSVLGDMPYVDEDTLIICEAVLKEDFSYAGDYGFDVERVKNYKTNKHVFLRKKSAE